MVSLTKFLFFLLRDNWTTFKFSCGIFGGRWFKFVMSHNESEKIRSGIHFDFEEVIVVFFIS
jgi:hypothetical protein